MYGLYMYIDLDNYQFLHLIGKKKKKKIEPQMIFGTSDLWCSEKKLKIPNPQLERW